MSIKKNKNPAGVGLYLNFNLLEKFNNNVIIRNFIYFYTEFKNLIFFYIVNKNLAFTLFWGFSFYFIYIMDILFF